MEKLIALKSDGQFLSFLNPLFDLTAPDGYIFKTVQDFELPKNLDSSYYFIDDKWVYKPAKISDIDQIENAWSYARSKRNELLQSSDWTQLPDVPLQTKETWAGYRQQLRDITNQTDPFNIIWPTLPN